MKSNLVKKYGVWLLCGVIAIVFATIIGITIYRSNLREIKLDGIVIGYTKDEQLAIELLEEVKASVNEENGNTIQWDVNLSMEKGKGKRASSKAELKKAMEETLESLKEEQAQLSYALKIDDYEVILKSKKEVKEVLQKTQEKYSKTSDVQIALVTDEKKGTLVPEVNMVTKSDKNQHVVAAARTVTDQTEQSQTNKKSKKSQNEVVKVAFAEEIEVEPVYVKSEELTQVKEAVLDITKEKDQDETYQVKKGDTISGIANENGMTVKEFMKLNTQIKDTDSIMPGDEVVISVPTPELSVIVQKEELTKKKYYKRQLSLKYEKHR